ncbi:integrase core domain protein, partial [Shigella flexneri 1485-80]
FAPTAPNQVWVADLTYVATQEGWLYLAGIKDVYTCEIVGYAMGERMTKELTGKALFMALRSQRPLAGLIHHSDRGSQYCAYDYRVIQEQSGLKTSMSRKGHCYDNAPMESFWGTLKNESLSHYRFNNRDEAISVIREYIEIFYNRQRRHSRLGNISPAAFKGKISSDDCSKKEQMVVSAIASTPHTPGRTGKSYSPFCVVTWLKTLFRIPARLCMEVSVMVAPSSGSPVGVLITPLSCGIGTLRPVDGVICGFICDGAEIHRLQRFRVNTTGFQLFFIFVAD